MNFGFGADILRELGLKLLSGKSNLLHALQFALLERQMSIVVGVICQAS